MNKPITLHIPSYYDQVNSDDHSLKLIKTKPLLKDDKNQAIFLASIEALEGYECKIKEIPEEYLPIASKCFKRDIEEGWELMDEVEGGKVYTYNWDDKACHFRIYWIVISEEYVLQLVGIFEPNFSGFYKRHFMTYFQSTKMDTTFDFSKVVRPEELFEVIKIPVDVSALAERMEEQQKQVQKDKFLAENLKVSKPKFYAVLKKELKEKGEARIDAFMCEDWNLYYDLYNPENFSDPDSTVEWEDNSSVFDYYEQPFTDNSKVNIYTSEAKLDTKTLKKLVENKVLAEQKLLSFFEHYTFNNGGAYAAGIHYQYAKIEIERLQDTKYTNQEFLKRNLCLTEIGALKDKTKLKLHFACSWDTEHGIDVVLNAEYEVEI